MFERSNILHYRSQGYITAMITHWVDQENLRKNAHILALSGENDDDESVFILVQRETHYMPPEDYLQRLRNRTLDVNARREAVGWILKVVHLFVFFDSLIWFYNKKSCSPSEVIRCVGTFFLQFRTSNGLPVCQLPGSISLDAQNPGRSLSV